MSMEYRELRGYDDLFEECAEWMGLKWTKSMIKRELRGFFPGITLRVMDYIMYRARKVIRSKYGINPQEYKGSQITFYEYVMRGKEKMHDKLTAAERLDKLFGLEHISDDNVDDIAAQIRDGITSMKASVPNPNEKGSDETKVNESKPEEDNSNGRERDSKLGQSSSDNSNESTNKEDFADISDDNVPPELLEGIKFNKDDSSPPPYDPNDLGL